MDLVFSRGAALPMLEIEIKSDTRPELVDLKGLREFSEEYPQAKCVVLCRTQKSYEFGNIQVLPWATGVKELLKAYVKNS